MEQFVVSARKYRPQTFKDVVGQQAITSTLLNAIETNHLASALLFTGPRGVGKTTCARIWHEKSINLVMMIRMRILLSMYLNWMLLRTTQSMTFEI